MCDDFSSDFSDSDSCDTDADFVDCGDTTDDYDDLSDGGDDYSDIDVTESDDADFYEINDDSFSLDDTDCDSLDESVEDSAYSENSDIYDDCSNTEDDSDFSNITDDFISNDTANLDHEELVEDSETLYEDEAVFEGANDSVIEQEFDEMAEEISDEPFDENSEIESDGIESLETNENTATNQMELVEEPADEEIETLYEDEAVSEDTNDSVIEQELDEMAEEISDGPFDENSEIESDGLEPLDTDETTVTDQMGFVEESADEENETLYEDETVSEDTNHPEIEQETDDFYDVQEDDEMAGEEISDEPVEEIPESESDGLETLETDETTTTDQLELVEESADEEIETLYEDETISEDTNHPEIEQETDDSYDVQEDDGMAEDEISDAPVEEISEIESDGLENLDTDETNASAQEEMVEESADEEIDTLYEDETVSEDTNHPEIEQETDDSYDSQESAGMVEEEINDLPHDEVYEDEGENTEITEDACSEFSDADETDMNFDGGLSEDSAQDLMDTSEINATSESVFDESIEDFFSDLDKPYYDMAEAEQENAVINDDPKEVETAEEYKDPEDPKVLTNSHAWQISNEALEDVLEAMRDDLRDKGLEDGPEMEAIIAAERIRSQEEIKQNLLGNTSFTHESVEYNAAVQALQNGTSVNEALNSIMEDLSDRDVSTPIGQEFVYETPISTTGHVEDIQSFLEQNGIDSEEVNAAIIQNEMIGANEINENVSEHNQYIESLARETSIDDYMDAVNNLAGLENNSEIVSGGDEDNMGYDVDLSENLDFSDSEINDFLNDDDENVTTEEIEEYLSDADSQITEELDAVLNDPELLTASYLSQQLINENMDSESSDIIPDAESISEVSEEITLTDEDIDSVYEGLETYDFQGVDCFEDMDRLDSDLERFSADNWEQMSLDEQKDAIRELADYVIDVTGLENPPAIEYYNNPQEGDYGGFSARDNTLYINEYMLYQNDEAADTVAHELWHAFQHERSLNPTTKLDAMYALNNEDYIRPEDDPVGYQSQLVESEARAFAQQIKDRLNERRK